MVLKYYINDLEYNFERDFKIFDTLFSNYEKFWFSERRARCDIKDQLTI